MARTTRRDALRLGAASLAVTAAGQGVGEAREGADAAPDLVTGGRDFSPISGAERQVVPSVCLQCVTEDPITAYLEAGRIVKIEGNPGAGSSAGKVCAKGQAGINQVYSPDRVLYPLLRKGRRGEGKWQRISWTEALDLLVEGGSVGGRMVKGLRALRSAGTPERFMFHFGRMVGSDATIIYDHFLPAYGTGTIGDHSSICMSAFGTAARLIGMRPRTWDLENAKVVLNFGASPLEATVGHVPIARRWVEARARGATMYTFDVRLSATAARSSAWIPIKPATDLAVILALCRLMLDGGAALDSFLETYTNVTTAELRAHLDGYTPEWAEAQSGVPAATIRSIGALLHTDKPSACVSFRGAYMHHNGVQTQRAITLLHALANPEITAGSRVPGVAWSDPFPPPAGEVKRMGFLAGAPGAYVAPDDVVSHQIAQMLDQGPERPDIYMVYCHNPVYSNGDSLRHARVYADEEKIPFLVAVDVTLSETSELADLVLPDATYLERWGLAGRPSADFRREFYLRQPVHPPRGEARSFADVACEIARRLGIDLGFASSEEFVSRSCDSTPGVREAGGFEYMREHGVWVDTSARPAPAPQGTLSVRSDLLGAKGFSAIPAWMPVPEHQSMGPDELILTTFKAAVHTQSRTQNCKWLSEVYHANPAWIHPRAAAARGIADGDEIRIWSTVGEIVTRAFVTEGVHPSAVAVSHHGGHWAHGRYASGRPGPFHRPESDDQLMWWKDYGAHVNVVIPAKGDPIGGAMCWNDTVVRISKVTGGGVRAAASRPATRRIRAERSASVPTEEGTT